MVLAKLIDATEEIRGRGKVVDLEAELTLLLVIELAFLNLTKLARTVDFLHLLVEAGNLLDHLVALTGTGTNGLGIYQLVVGGALAQELLRRQTPLNAAFFQRAILLIAGRDENVLSRAAFDDAELLFRLYWNEVLFTGIDLDRIVIHTSLETTGIARLARDLCSLLIEVVFVALKQLAAFIRHRWVRIKCV